MVAAAAPGHAGIGGSAGNANGTIAIEWRANVQANGGRANNTFGGGAGIGGGGSDTQSLHGGANISVNTVGLVKTDRGDFDFGYDMGAGAFVGQGGGTNSTYGVDSIGVATAIEPAPLTSGRVKMLNVYQQLVDGAQVNGIVWGSAVTYLALPGAGNQVAWARGNPVGPMVSLGNDVYRMDVISPYDEFTPVIQFEAIPVLLTLTADPGASQIYPGNVTLSTTLTDTDIAVSDVAIVFSVNGTQQDPVQTNEDGVATLTLTSPAAGIYTFEASFAGEGTHAAATATPITNYVVFAPQNDFAIDLPDPTRVVYGEAPLELSTSGQLSDGDVIWSVPADNGVVTIDPHTGENTILGAGTVVVTATAPADASHAARTVTRTLTIAPRQVTVTVDPITIIFGDDSELSWTASPALIGTDTLQGSLKFDGQVRIGTNQVVVDTPFSNANYSVTFVPGSVLVEANQAQETVIGEIQQLPLPIRNHDGADEVVAVTKALNGQLSEEERAALPEDVLDRLSDAQDQSAVVNHSDLEQGVLASADALNWDVRLLVAPESEYSSFAAKLETGRTLVSLHDIHFVNTSTNEVWQPPLGTTVDIELTKVQLEGFSQIQVQHQQKDGSLETVPSTTVGTHVQFVGASFSMYGVTGVAKSKLSLTGAEGAVTGMRLLGFAALFVGASAVVIAATRKRRDT